MKKMFKRISIGVMAIAAALEMALPARAQIYGTATTTVTNVTGTATNVIANYTSYSLSNSILFDLTRYNNYALAIAYTPLVTNETMNFKFRQSLDGTTNTAETADSFTITGINLANTNAIIIVSNLTVNAVGYLYLDSITSTVTNGIIGIGVGTNLASTNNFPTVTLSVKPPRALY